MVRTIKQFLRGCACITLLIAIGLAASSVTLAADSMTSVALEARDTVECEIEHQDRHRRGA